MCDHLKTCPDCKAELEERKRAARLSGITEAVKAQCDYCRQGVPPVLYQNDNNVYHLEVSPCRAASIWRTAIPNDLALAAHTQRRQP